MDRYTQDIQYHHPIKVLISVTYSNNRLYHIAIPSHTTPPAQSLAQSPQHTPPEVTDWHRVRTVECDEPSLNQSDPAGRGEIGRVEQDKI